MKKAIFALSAGVALALAPAGTAFADVAPHATGKGKAKAYGNCQYSSATGDRTRLPDGAGKGNGGHVIGGKPVACVEDTAAAEPSAEPLAEPTPSTDGVKYAAGEDAPAG